jgi:hypothetical protein
LPWQTVTVMYCIYSSKENVASSVVTKSNWRGASVLTPELRKKNGWSAVLVTILWLFRSWNCWIFIDE